MRALLAGILFTGLAHAADAVRANAPTPEFEELKASFQDPSEGWQALFNGRDLTGWEPQDYGRRPSKPNDWRVPVVVVLDPADETKLAGEPYTGQGGALPALLANREGKSANLVTAEEFADAEIYVEFAIPRKSNSGVCVMGNYEIQLYDSFGKPDDALTVSDNGAIYAFPGKRGRFGGKPPRVNVSRGPGEWQSLHLWFQAPRFGEDGKKIENARFVKVELNGVEVHRDYELIKSTRASQPWPERAKAPLLLQGDHGPIAYRAVYIRELQAEDRPQLTEQ
jgi:hypothetical protein